MKQSIVIYGPRGCGKTINAERLQKHFGLERIVDEGKDYWPFDRKGPALESKGVLYLVEEPPLTVKKLNGAILMKFTDAMHLAGLTAETK